MIKQISKITVIYIHRNLNASGTPNYSYFEPHRKHKTENINTSRETQLILELTKIITEPIYKLENIVDNNWQEKNHGKHTETEHSTWHYPLCYARATTDRIQKSDAIHRYKHEMSFPKET
jgi:hypothetical protein